MTAFIALLRRDFHVVLRSAVLTLLGDVSQAALIAIVFAIIFPRLRLVSEDFGTIVLPGLMSTTILISGVHGVLMPLWDDLSGSREVDERLLAPILVVGVALEKIVAGTITAAVTGIIALPTMMLIMHGVIQVHPLWVGLVPMILLSSLVSAAFGMTIGSIAGARFSGLVSAIIISPMMLFGCAYYPWVPLKAIGPLRYLFLLNPLVFMSEALRFGVTPQIPHMPLSLLITGLLVYGVGLTVAAAHKFEQRTIL